MDPALYDIPRLAAATGLEESLVRYYERSFPEFLPAKAPVGDRSVYPAEAVEVFQSLHRMLRLEGLSVPEVKRRFRREQAQTRIRLNYARVLVVASGKGGVGKTNAALNIAIQLERRGLKSIVFDADFGLANVHVLAGVSPTRSLVDVARGNATVGEALAEGPEHIGIVAGGSGVLDLADLRPEQRQSLIEGLQDLERCADVIVVDAAPGISANVLDFVRVSDDLLLVVTPDLLSVTDAYGFLKAMVHRGIRVPVRILVNQVRSTAEAADVFVRLETCARRFLSIEVESLGYVFRDANIQAATAAQSPVSVCFPSSKASRCYARVAGELSGARAPVAKTASTFAKLLRSCREAEPAGIEKTRNGSE